MVQIVENHADIAGTLLGAAPAPDRPGYVALRVKVESAAAVAEWPNLLDRHVGQEVSVLTRQDSAAAATAPGPIRLRVRKSGLTAIFADD